MEGEARMSEEQKTDVLITQVAVVPRGEPIFGEQVIVVSVEDDAAGSYLTIKSLDPRDGVAVGPDEIDHLKAAMGMIANTIEILESHAK